MADATCWPREAAESHQALRTQGACRLTLPTYSVEFTYDKDVRASYEDPTMKRILHPEDAVGLNPVYWLATYLKR